MEKLYKKTGWKNKPNLSTPLGATNLKKIDEALDGLDNRTIEMNESIATNRRNIEGLYSTVNAHTSAIEGLTEKSNDIDMLKIVSTASGSPVYMDDASNMGLEGIDFFGESKQMQTTGKNFLKFSQGSTIINGITFTVNADKSVTVNGTATADAVLLLTTSTRGEVDLNSLTGKKIILSGCPNGGSNSTYKFQFWSDSKMAVDTGNGATLDLSTVPDTWNFAISIISGTTVNNLTFKPMIRLASTDATYEPYTGGKASPNPDYPQPIESKIVNRVDVLGKNLLDCSGLSVQTTAGITFTPKYDDNGALQYVNVNGTWDSSNTATNTRYKLGTWYPKTKGNYVLNGMTYLNELSYLCLDKNGGGGAYEVVANTSKEFTVSEDAEYYDVWLRIASGTTVNNLKIYPMIRLASITDATYEPYQSQTVNLSAPIELNGIGGVRDTDKLKKFGVVVFDGSEGWVHHDEQQYPHLFKTSITPYANGNATVLCSHFLYDSGDLKGGLDGCRFRLASSADVFYISSSKHTDVAEFKAWLANNPVTLVYPLAEPIETELPQADIDAIKALHSYKPNTVVMNDADAEMDVHYVADAKTYIDKKFEALASAIEK